MRTLPLQSHSSPARLRAGILSGALAVTLAACGGGGGGSAPTATAAAAPSTLSGTAVNGYLQGARVLLDVATATGSPTPASRPPSPTPPAVTASTTARSPAPSPACG